MCHAKKKRKKKKLNHYPCECPQDLQSEKLHCATPSAQGDERLVVKALWATGTQILHTGSLNLKARSNTFTQCFKLNEHHQFRFKKLYLTQDQVQNHTTASYHARTMLYLYRDATGLPAGRDGKSRAEF